MAAESVVLCPPAPGTTAAAVLDEVAAGLLGAAVRVCRPEVPPDGGDADDVRTRAAHWVAHTAIAVGVSGVPAPVLLVSYGAANTLLPALSFAQRAARRPVGGYVCLGGPAPDPAAAPDWPDAPVTYVVPSDPDDTAREAALTARLRGWDVVEGDALAAVLRALSGR
jgi:hypothetical protein